MSSITQQLHTKGLILPPGYVPSNVQYEVITGSIAYGVSEDTSDFDVVGFCIPPKSVLFPHTEGYIHGFDQLPEFNQFQAHHVHDHSALGGKGRVYDLTVYNIVRFFSLAMENNPNMVDVLFVPANCILTCTSVGQMVRENRKLFLHKGCYHRFKGYAFSQLSRVSNSQRGPEMKALRDFEAKYKVSATLDQIEVEINSRKKAS